MPASILIIDDYADNRELLRIMLEAEGHEVREAGDGLEGVRAARENMPDLILVDLSMPGLDGWGVLEELRSDERTRHIPCASVSASPEGDHLPNLAEGFDAYLMKPFRRKELIETVERLLAGRT
jgi:CheY-like chemotaxis protein